MIKNHLELHIFELKLKYTHRVYKSVIFLFFILNQTIFSQSIQDIQKLRQEYEKFQRNRNNQSLEPMVESNLNEPETPKKSVIKLKKLNNKEKTSHFGYGFFTLRDTLAFWENLPIPPDYLLGPGDEIIISIWGETQLRKQFTISKDGKIYDDKVGLLFLTGKNIDGALEYLKNQYGRIYSTLIKNNPSSFIDVSLGSLRSINVNFVGQVSYPGVYPLHPFSNVITGLIQAGGVDTTGSLRKIMIKRGKEIVTLVDLYDYLINGSLPDGIQLRDQDIIVVPPRKSYIEVDSAVVMPGIYESINDETVYDIVQHAGGFLNNASNVIGINEKIQNDSVSNQFKYYPRYIDIEDSKKIKSEYVDKITVQFLKNENNFVNILGQVKVPGEYYFNEKMYLSDLFKLSSGFEDTTFLKSVYIDQGEIIRKKPDKRFDEVLVFNIAEILNEEKDIKLQNLDKIVIHANLNFFEKKNVQLLGEVNIPGSYPVLYNSESLASIITRAGGFTEKSFQDGIEVYRDSLRVAWQNLSLPLIPGDSIVVKQRPGTVFVTGEVYNPGLIEFDDRKSLRQYIDLAGGNTKIGDIRDIIVIYANGEVMPRKRFFTPKIKEGCTIIVNKKELSEPFDPVDFANVTLSFVSSIMTVLVLSQQLQN